MVSCLFGLPFLFLPPFKDLRQLNEKLKKKKKNPNKQKEVFAGKETFM